MGDFNFDMDTYSLEVRVGSLGMVHAKLPAFMKHELYKFQRVVRETYDESGLQVRSGALKRSIQPGEVKFSSDEVSGELLVGQKLKYARIQEFGGDIQAVNVTWLTIPVGPMLTPAGVSRYPSIRDAGKQWDLRFIVSRRIVLGRKKGSQGDWQLVYVLRKKVTIPARRFVQMGVKKFQPTFIRDTERLVAEAMNPKKA